MPTANTLKVLEPLLKRQFLLVTKSSCPFCHRAIQLAKNNGVNPTILEIDTRPDGSALQKTLTEMTKQRTVPYVFAEGKFQGGCSDLEKQSASFWAKLK